MELEKCKHIPTNLLRELVKIEKLILIDCGEIDSLDFIDELQNLKFFSFYGTTVLSGDLTPCLKLDYASTNNKKSYNIKDKDFDGYFVLSIVIAINKKLSPQLGFNREFLSFLLNLKNFTDIDIDQYIN